MPHGFDSLAAREAEHRISNHLALLSGLLHLKAAKLRKEAVGDRDGAILALAEICAHLDAIARLHRSLAGKTGALVMDLAEKLAEATSAFASIQPRPELTLDLEPGCMVRSSDVLSISRIVIEALTNASKYGAEPVILRCRHGKDRSILVEVSDGGPGLPTGFDPVTSKGMGLSLIRNLGDQIGTAVEFLSDESGLTVRLLVPKRQDPSEHVGGVSDEDWCDK